MECFVCGNDAGNEKACPWCGADMEAYHRILLAAGSWYNDGLRRARVRDLSGAISSLRQSLAFNKYHTDARNLLGLCLYETGETVEALAEWVISKNLQPQSNRADVYLKELQRTRGELDRMRNATRKYNMAVRYCRDGNRDLAKIQLRRVINTNPGLVRAQQLLALLLIQEENWVEARRCLIAANRVDAANTVTLRYMREVREGLKGQMQQRRSAARETSSHVVEIQDGNELIMMPRVTFMDRLDESRISFLNAAVGLVIGLLITVFLILPAMRTNQNNRTARALAEADSVAQTYDKTVSELTERAESLEEELSAYVGKADIVGSYEGVLRSVSALSKGDYDGALSAIDAVNPDLLSESGREAYDGVYDSVSSYEKEQRYQQGYVMNRQGDFEGAKEVLRTLVEEDAVYGNGAALYYLADSYDKTSDPENALRWFRTLLSEAPGSEFAPTASAYIQQWGDIFPEAAAWPASASEEVPAEEGTAEETTQTDDAL